MERVDLIKDVLIALASLLWPVFAFTCLFLFKKEIRGLLVRMKKSNFFGNEFEFEKEIDQFSESVDKSRKKIPLKKNEDGTEQGEREIKILNSSLSDPRIGILVLAREIEKEVRQLIAGMGLGSENKFANIRSLF